MVEEFVLGCKWRTNWSLLFVWRGRPGAVALTALSYSIFTIRSRLLLRGNIKAYGTIIVPVFYCMKLRLSHYVMSITRACSRIGCWGKWWT